MENKRKQTNILRYQNENENWNVFPVVLDIDITTAFVTWNANTFFLFCFSGIEIYIEKSNYNINDAQRWRQFIYAAFENVNLLDSICVLMLLHLIAYYKVMRQNTRHHARNQQSKTGLTNSATRWNGVIWIFIVSVDLAVIIFILVVSRNGQVNMALVNGNERKWLSSALLTNI